MNTAIPPTFPLHASIFTLAGQAGPLEVACDTAAPEVARRGSAVICHPHPLHGGTMHNKVVTTVEHALRASGLDTARFNFRGVGASAGSYDDGRGESEDLATVVAWLRRVRPDHALWLAGFSFGSFVSIRSAARLEADVLLSIAPPVGRWDFRSIALPRCPWLIVQGEADEVVDPTAVFGWIDSLPLTPSVLRMPDTGHFFHRKLIDLRALIQQRVAAWLPPARA